MRTVGAVVLSMLFLAGTSAAEQRRGHLETGDLPPHLRDRGEGIPMSIFGIYVQKGQFLVYPFFEYYRDHDAEYSPNDFGDPLDQDFRGKYEAYEGIFFLGYGVTDRLAFELEAAIIDAAQRKSPSDPSGIPDRISESGLGDVEGQLRWRWNHEQGSRPEFFSYFETVGPTADEGSLIGTSDWEFKLGTGAVRGFSWGTMTARLAVEYDLAEDSGGLGEMAIEYLRRLSDHWRIFAGFEGTQDEVEAITEAQLHFNHHVVLKLNSAFGVTSKATDWAPEVGVLFSF